VKAEITGDGHELVVTIDVSELTVTATDQGLRAKLPSSAPGIATGVVDMLTPRPEPGEPRPVRIVRVRLIRSELIGESIIELTDAREVFA
jgi:hypothetical protein